MAQVSTLIIDHTKVADSLTDFPVYVDLSDMNAEFWATVANGGGDIRVFKSDGTTELPREVVSCDTSTETGELHFKYIGTLSSSSDTEIQIHADGVSSDYATNATYGAENVWSDYIVVSHDGGLTDSTSNGNNGTNNGSTTLATSKIGSGRSFVEASSQYIELPAMFAGTETELSVQIWAKMDANSTTSSDRIVTLDRSLGFFTIRANNGSADDIIGYFGNGAETATANSQTVTNWKKISVVCNESTNAFLYVDGLQVGTDASLGAFATLTGSHNRIGANREASPTFFLDGDTDEFRVRTSLISADWELTEYNNQNSPSTFYTATEPMLTVNITDTMSLLETTTLPRSLLFSQTDTIEMTDSASLLKVIFVNIVETIGLSEATSSVRSRVISIIDSLGLDEIAQVRKKIRNLSKNIATGITNRVKNSMTVKNRSKS